MSRLGRFECFDASDKVVPLRLGREAVSPVCAGGSGIALSALSAIGTGSASVALVALGTLRPLRPLLAPRRLSSASRLNTVKLSRSNRGTARRAVSPLIRLKSHQASSPIGKIESPGNVDAPG